MGSTTCLWNHYNFKHKLSYGVDNQPEPSSRRATDDSEEILPPNRKRQSWVSTSTSSFTSITQDRQELITQALTKMLTMDMLPTSFVKNEGFKSLMSVLEPGYKVPCRKTIRKRIEALYSDELVKAQSIIGKVQTHIALTTDGWTSRALDSYVTITAHYFDSDWALHSMNLKTEELSTNHTSENLRSFILDSIEEWAISARVSAIVHHNAKNITNAVRNLDNIDSVACAAHTLQLSIKKGMEMENCRHLLKKASNLVSAFNHSAKRTTALEKHLQQLEKPVLSLIQSCTTRWNSSFYMVERLLRLRPSLVAVLADREIFDGRTAQKIEIFEDAWLKLSEVSNLLKPLENPTTVLCSESKITISLVQPIMNSLVRKHLNVNCNDTSFVTDLKNEISFDLIHRLGLNTTWETRCVDPSHIASFLDPRHKNLLFESSEEFRTKIFTTAKEIYQSSLNMPSTSLADDTPTFMDILLGGDNINEMQSEFEKYISEPQINHNLEARVWWKDHEKQYHFTTSQEISCNTSYISKFRASFF
ncbi:E3 SUMO-protein ligase ZBED1-like [Anastrepha obliqua]|uniref:E3 SUMO-protein ligase ZBED1-like n=1 Tax=Anastrepha obliqua TaxID=95512 RepID=UPI00240A0261|nr:E3 SUMO-protein ligase ZBED1-like [Anastrepha obliqua]